MTTIQTAREFFDEVVNYNMQQYKPQPGHLAATFNLANSLFCMHEWLWVVHNAQLESHYGRKFSDEKKFNIFVQDLCPSFKHIRDLANASKHVVLKKPSTSAANISHTRAVKSVIGEAIIGVSKIGRDVVAIDNGGQHVDFESCANDVHCFWGNLLKQLGV